MTTTETPPGAVGAAVAAAAAAKPPMTLAGIPARYAQPEPALIGKLPRVTCSDCSDRRVECQKHQKARCDVCHAYVSTQHIHIDYLGHAETTRCLIEIDPDWSWEPVAWDGAAPALIERGGELVMWGRLTVLGKTLPCVGSVEKGKFETDKQLIGDLIRNGAMRFGIALQLWSKQERAEAETVAPKSESRRPSRQPVVTRPPRPSSSPDDAPTEADNASPAMQLASRFGRTAGQMLVDARRMAIVLQVAPPTKLAEITDEILDALDVKFNDEAANLAAANTGG